jgi:putative iron-dependent peroxidase
VVLSCNSVVILCAVPMSDAHEEASMPESQPGIFAEGERMARYMRFDLAADADFESALHLILGLDIDESIVVGLGPSFTTAVKADVPPLRAFPQLVSPGIDIASTQSALWIWLRGDDRGSLLHESRLVIDDLSEEFEMVDLVDGFMHLDSRDLTGYVDGTENPKDDEAVKAGILNDAGELDGSSFVAVQQWVHDLDEFESLSQEERDHIIGRRLEDNEEIEDAPDSAHIKRTAQEDFEPEAFIVRRSLPFIDGDEEGLMFVAFGRTLDPFEAQLRRMLGMDDGIVDGLLRFSRPITGGYYWCPPVSDDQLVITSNL